MPRIKSIRELQKELARRTRQLSGLQARRAKAAARLAAIDRTIVAMGGEPEAPGAVRGRRGRRNGRRKLAGKVGRPRQRRRATGKPLIKYVQDVLAKAPPQGMRAKYVAEAVKKAGYRSYSKDFYGIVATTLRSKLFKKLRRGVYTLAR
jgi:hypothetical protein